MSASTEVEEEEVKICLCRGPESGNMVGCETCDEWFHFDCVGYIPPAGTSSCVLGYL